MRLLDLPLRLEHAMSRRSFLRSVASAAAALAVPRAIAQSAYPDRPVRVIVPFPAGGPADALARIVGDKLSQALGKPFVVDNKVGAGGNIGMAIR